MRAVVIDDSRAIRKILGKRLQEAGYDVVEAGNGREALEVLGTAGKVRLALIDWNMPEMNGLEFIRAVRHQHEYEGMVLLMVTTETEMSQMVRAPAAGANEYLMKPFTINALNEKLQLLGMGDGAGL
jgi:two-component system chemotaxis response regulator CheY